MLNFLRNAILRSQPTIGADDMEWQLEAWSWLLRNLGGLEALPAYPMKLPSRADFPPSGETGLEHVEAVFQQVTRCFGVDGTNFRLELQDPDVDPLVAPMAAVVDPPAGPLGTYRTDDERHLITVNPKALADLEQLISTLAHEICHPILLSIADEPPGGAEAEEFATDLAMVFFGFGIFGANTALVHRHYHDTASGSQGWSISRSGYLTQNEWGFALAVRQHLLPDTDDSWSRHLVTGALAHYTKNSKFLSRNPHLVEELLDAASSAS